MKILLAVNGTSISYAAVQSVADGVWPEGSEVKLLLVIEPPMTLASEVTAPPDDFYMRFEKSVRDYANIVIKHAAGQYRAGAAVEKAETEIRKAGGAKLKITTDVLTGSPKEKIIDEAEEWGAGLIVVGSHGFRRDRRQMIGSVSLAVASLAPCSVKVVPCRAE
jgi:nucleotide-binding universal stress UspA family protein